MGDFDFQGYVSQREQKVYGGVEEESRYAYAADVAMLKTFRRLKPVELAAAAVVRTYKNVLRNQYLGTTMRVGPKQVPRIYHLAEECAVSLGVPVPTVYVANSPYMNAYTFGTDDESFIVVHSKLVDDFSDDELKFVIGHETGHVQNKHVVYGTVLHLIKTNAAIFLRWLVPPAELALSAWYRRAEITCDRAGLLCTKDIGAASRTFLKLACGSQKLYDQLDVESYIEQFEEGKEGLGRFSEAFASHPYLPKRIQALRVFAESALYRDAIGEDGGLSMSEVDRRTSEIIQILDGAKGSREKGEQ